MKRDRSRQGAALITVLIVVVLMTLAGFTVINLASQQSYAANRLREQVKAQALAEAGANEAYSILKADFSKRESDEAFPETEFEDGSYDATVTAVGDDMALISCQAGCGAVAATVMCDVKDYMPGEEGGGSAPPTSPFAYSIFVNGQVHHNGSGIVVGNVHCNKDVTSNGSMEWGNAEADCNVNAHDQFRGNGSITIHGTVTAPKIKVNGTDNIREKVIADPGLLPMPVLDLTPFYQVALANGQVFDGTSYNGSQNWGLIPGGVRWFNGDVNFNGSASYQGCIIATGSVRFNGSLTQTQYQDFPAFVSRDANIRMNGSHTCEGLVYAAGEITWNGSGRNDGTIICGGNMYFNGSYGVIAYEYCEPGDPTAGGEGSSGSEVGITCWHR